MAANPIKKVKLNKRGVIKLLKSENVRQELLKVADTKLNGSDSSFIGWDRIHVNLKRNEND